MVIKLANLSENIFMLRLIAKTIGGHVSIVPKAKLKNLEGLDNSGYVL